MIIYFSILWCIVCAVVYWLWLLRSFLHLEHWFIAHFLVLEVSSRSYRLVIISFACARTLSLFFLLFTLFIYEAIIVVFGRSSVLLETRIFVDGNHNSFIDWVMCHFISQLKRHLHIITRHITIIGIRFIIINIY